MIPFYILEKIKYFIHYKGLKENITPNIHMYYDFCIAGQYRVNGLKFRYIRNQLFTTYYALDKNTSDVKTHQL